MNNIRSAINRFPEGGAPFAEYTLILLLVAATVFDFRWQRIPNWLIQVGVLFGLACNIAIPPYPQAGLLWPFEGMGLGFIAFLPLYLVGAMGAGDVKLMSMVGAFVGPDDMVGVLLFTMIAVGLLFIVHVLLHGTGGRILLDLRALFKRGLPENRGRMRPAASATKQLPYALAISAGTIAYLMARQSGLL